MNNKSPKKKSKTRTNKSSSQKTSQRQDKSQSKPQIKSVRKNIPDRYSIKKSSEGSHIICLESPNLSVRIEKGKVFSENSGRKANDRTIFLDGACDAAPFIDVKRQVYNLDHHTGVVRSFTLSTCEQAAILVMKGLDLTEKNWNIWANDPDLDTVLAIWVLLNHVHLNDEDYSTISEILPILRLEGLIDGIGLELNHFTAFPKKLQEETNAKIEILRKKEIAVKKSGKWEESDFIEYTIQVLKKIDELVYHPEDFKDFKGLDELARVELDDKNSAVVYRADMGIYEIEQHLNKMYGKNPGLIVLQKRDGHYTLRKSDIFTPLDMNLIYDRLNLYDKNVSGKIPKNRWGGAGDIGGSPRTTGTYLNPSEIADIIRESFYKPNFLEKLVRISWTTFLGVGLAILGWICLGFWKFSDAFGFWILESFGLPLEIYTVVTVLYTTTLFFAIGRKIPWFYGMRIPAGNDWWLFFPITFLGALMGGAWIPLIGIVDAVPGISNILMLLSLPIAVEVLFRGIIHGQLVRMFRIQKSGGEWFVSTPVIISAMIYALAVVLSPVHFTFPIESFLGDFAWVSQMLGGFVFGLSAGLCRERSESIIPVVGFHFACILLVSLIQFVG
ncbi:CPBP family intramembrane glutamic endopeptidase [Leptospira sp. GIMC2001]|uniref:CPBP family intramembrane glutamic endopeptidase n=1 Tax=Leptospira sp. GIMC2001 TaxID=1513297 RepID=UPI00234A6077|nr:type II CAAX endopeptidase family protein [Leptospira sp. GIMC2001]WCL50297.1 type II CAAX endopeptidase family protein [Leptospira sp. GIMC2001]